MITDPKRAIHKGVYESEMRGRYRFIYAFTLCTGQVWLNTTGDPKRVTCRRCKKAAQRDARKKEKPRG